MGPLPNGRNLWLINGGLHPNNLLYKLWEPDPPSGKPNLASEVQTFGLKRLMNGKSRGHLGVSKGNDKTLGRWKKNESISHQKGKRNMYPLKSAMPGRGW